MYLVDGASCKRRTTLRNRVIGPVTQATRATDGSKAPKFLEIIKHYQIRSERCVMANS